MSKIYKNWKKTKLNKKKTKIKSDMFITDSRGTFTFMKVKKGVPFKRCNLTKEEAYLIIEKENLEKVADTIFNNCYSYRNVESNIIIKKLIDYML